MYRHLSIQISRQITLDHLIKIFFYYIIIFFYSQIIITWLWYENFKPSKNPINPEKSLKIVNFDLKTRKTLKIVIFRCFLIVTPKPPRDPGLPLPPPVLTPPSSRNPAWEILNLRFLTQTLNFGDLDPQTPCFSRFFRFFWDFYKQYTPPPGNRKSDQNMQVSA